MRSSCDPFELEQRFERIAETGSSRGQVASFVTLLAAEPAHGQYCCSAATAHLDAH